MRLNQLAQQEQARLAELERKEKQRLEELARIQRELSEKEETLKQEESRRQETLQQLRVQSQKVEEERKKLADLQQREQQLRTRETQLNDQQVKQSATAQDREAQLKAQERSLQEEQKKLADLRAQQEELRKKEARLMEERTESDKKREILLLEKQRVDEENNRKKGNAPHHVKSGSDDNVKLKTWQERSDSAAVGVLEVTIYRARGLKALNGSGADAYVALSVTRDNEKSRLVKTDVKSKTVEPEWLFQAVINVYDPYNEELELRVMQHWKLATNELLGQKSWPISYFETSYDPAKSNPWVSLSGTGKHVQGELMVKFKYTSLKQGNITGPKNFEHKGHIGLSADGGFEVRNMPAEWKQLFKKAGITPNELRNPENARVMMEVRTESICCLLGHP
jgi:myosin heavy subunit